MTQGSKTHYYSMYRFSIIIVSWNALHHLKTFLPSVAESDYPDFEIILADNASTDGTAGWINRQYPQVKVVTFDENYGYCGGNNRAVPHATGDVLVFLNNDVKVKKNWLQGLAGCFNEDDSLAALQPKMRSYENPGSFEYAGAAGGYLDKYGFPFCRGRLFDTVETDTGQYDSRVPLLWASGAALVIRKKVFLETGGFDEHFEFHMEEIDLCWRLWNRGYKVGFCPESIVYHLGGGSLPMHSPRKVYYNYRNNLMMLFKNYSSRSIRLRLPVRYGLDIIAAIRCLLRGEWKEFKAIVHAHRDFFKRLPILNAQRRKLQEERLVDEDPAEILNINAVTAYFVHGKKMFSDLPQIRI